MTYDQVIDLAIKFAVAESEAVHLYLNKEEQELLSEDFRIGERDRHEEVFGGSRPG